MRRARPAAFGKQVVLLAVAALLSTSAALAIAILLFGDFGETEGRILATTGLLAGYGLLALPAAMLVDQRRLPALAGAVLVLAAAGAALAVAAIWTEEPSDAHGKAIGTVSAFLVASAQVSALALRRPERDRALVRGLFAASSVLATVVASAAGAMLYVVVDELVPESHARGNERAASVALLLGFALMLGLDNAFA